MPRVISPIARARRSRLDEILGIDLYGWETCHSPRRRAAIARRLMRRS
jgi:hypothetical protein